MLKPMMIRTLTLPWATIAAALLYAAINKPEIITEPWQFFLMTAAFGICIMAVIVGWVVADEVKDQDEQILIYQKRAKK